MTEIAHYKWINWNWHERLWNFSRICLLVLDLKNLKVFAGDDPNAECTLIIDDEDLFNIGNGTLGAQEALAQNKLDIEGNIELALKLVPFISSL